MKTIYQTKDKEIITDNSHWYALRDFEKKETLFVYDFDKIDEKQMVNELLGNAPSRKTKTNSQGSV